MTFSRNPLRVSATLILLIALACPVSLYSLEKPETELQEVGIKTKLGTQLDLNLTFKDSDGKDVQLKELFRPNIPVIITPVYYDCPRLCGFVIKAMVTLVNAITLSIGKEYDIISVSFDPTEGPDLAKSKSESVFHELKDSSNAHASWHFLTGNDANIKPLMSQLGFGYKKDGQEYAHGSAIMILTPQGEISQYFTGIEYPEWDARLALVEASKGGIGNAIDHFMLFCYKFDPTQGKYTMVAFNVARVGILFFVFVFALIAFKYSKKARAI